MKKFSENEFHRQSITDYLHIINIFPMLLGRVILDKNSNIRTVVNKMGSIETEFRTFPMEVIAGRYLLTEIFL